MIEAARISTHVRRFMIASSAEFPYAMNHIRKKFSHRQCYKYFDGLSRSLEFFLFNFVRAVVMDKRL